MVRADQAAAALDRDVGAPSSRVRRARRDHDTVDLKIKRSDTSGATGCVKLPTAGVKKVLVFASGDGGSYHRIGKTTKGKLTFHGKPGGRYRFFSIAVDRDGNCGAAPRKPDLKLKR